MKIMASLFLSGGLLLLAASPVNAHPSGHHDYDRGDRYYYAHEVRREMPRWLKRKKAFRQWYRHSPFKYRRAITWARIYEIYRWERRYSRQHYSRHHRGHDVYRDRDDDRRGRRRH